MVVHQLVVLQLVKVIGAQFLIQYPVPQEEIYRVQNIMRFPTDLKDNNDFSYPWMAQLDAHTWYLVFYCGKMHGANSIYGMTFDMRITKTGGID